MSPSPESQLRAYLLGQLAPADRDELRLAMASDPELLARLAIVEEELIDEYISGSLQGHERSDFEANFLNTADKREKVEFAESMHRVLSDPDPPAASPRTRWIPIAIAASLAIAAALGWFFLRTNRPIQTASIVEIVLQPGVTRDASGARSPSISGSTTVRFRLIQFDPPPASLTATIREPDRDPIFTTNLKIPPNTPEILFDVPTSRLHPGDFEIVLAGPDGQVSARYILRLSK